eukprot:2748614-Rhodomonas_salina.3
MQRSTTSDGRHQLPVGTHQNVLVTIKWMLLQGRVRLPDAWCERGKMSASTKDAGGSQDTEHHGRNSRHPADVSFEHGSFSLTTNPTAF